MTEFKIKANNIKCGGCATNIKNSLNELSEVESVNVNIETGEVTIIANNIEQSAIEKKLNEAGYPAK